MGTSGGSYQLVEKSNAVRQIVSIDISTLQEADVIGSDNGPRYTGTEQWDGNRKTGIDHIAVVIKDPNGALWLAESHGGKGVNIRTLADGVAAWNKYGAKNNFGTAYIDPSDQITKTKSFWLGNYRPAPVV